MAQVIHDSQDHIAPLLYTHDGIFHCDEVMAISTLEKFLGIHFQVIRTRDKKLLQEALLDKNIWVLDVGYSLDYMMNNVDHHQNKDLPATNLLILNYLRDTNVIKEDLYKELYPLYKGVSNFDTNQEEAHDKYSKYDVKHEIRTLSSIIGGFNSVDIQQDEQFRKAIYFMSEVLDNEVGDAYDRIQAREDFKYKVELNEGKVIVFEKHNVMWKQLAGPNVLLCVSKDFKGQWNVTSINDKIIKLEEDDILKSYLTNKEDFVFRHPSGFMSGYITKDSAIEIAIATTLNYK